MWFPTYLRTASHLHTCLIWLCLGCSLHFQRFSYLARNASLHVNLPDMIQAIWLPNCPKPLGGFQWLANCCQVSNICCRVKASQCKHMPVLLHLLPTTNLKWLSTATWYKKHCSMNPTRVDEGGGVTHNVSTFIVHHHYRMTIIIR